MFVSTFSHVSPLEPVPDFIRRREPVFIHFFEEFVVNRITRC